MDKKKRRTEDPESGPILGPKIPSKSSTFPPFKGLWLFTGHLLAWICTSIERSTDATLSEKGSEFGVEKKILEKGEKEGRENES